MTNDYIIAMGGTGARCLEACIFLAAAGLFEKPIHALLIDPDQNNGNAGRTKRLFSYYHQLYLSKQPEQTQNKKGWLGLGGKETLPSPHTFQAGFNLKGKSEQHPYFWQDPNNPERRFKDVIGDSRLPKKFQNFVRLFYDETDLNMKLGKGYRGRPNIGAVTIMSDLRRTHTSPGKGLHEILTAIRNDLPQGARVFVFGSVFGGTGAAGIPTIPELFEELLKGDSSNQDGVQNLRFGCSMMMPYFTFPRAEASSSDGPAPDPDLHLVATQAALMHYAQVPPGYQHVYTIGAPEVSQTNAHHEDGGDGQENVSHYAELIAALAAGDFFSIPEIFPADRHLHFTNGTEVNWRSLPGISNLQQDRLNIKRRLLAFTTFAYLYCHVLHLDVKNANWYNDQAWYRDNFLNHGLSLQHQGEKLETLSQFLGLYLQWLNQLGQPLGAGGSTLFNWAAFSLEGSAAEREIGKLAQAESENGLPKFTANSYAQIMDRLNKLRLDFGSTNPDPVGLLIYLLNEVSSSFCLENYHLQKT